MAEGPLAQRGPQAQRGPAFPQHSWGSLLRDWQAEPHSSKRWQTGSASCPCEPPHFSPSPGAAGPLGQCRAASTKTLLHPAGKHQRNRQITAGPRSTPTALAHRPGSPPAAPSCAPPPAPPPKAQCNQQPAPRRTGLHQQRLQRDLTCAKVKEGARRTTATVVPCTGNHPASAARRPVECTHHRALKGTDPGLDPGPAVDVGSPRHGGRTAGSTWEPAATARSREFWKGEPVSITGRCRCRLGGQVGAASPALRCGGSRIRSQPCRAQLTL